MTDDAGDRDATAGYVRRLPFGRWSRLLAVLAALAVLATACGSDDDDAAGVGDDGSATAANGESGEPQPGGSLTWAQDDEPRSLDPIAADTRVNGDGMWAYAIFDSLMVTDFETGTETAPHLAESLESEDSILWTLRLREGVTFHDGTSLDAEAVKFNWDRYRAEAARPSPGAELIEAVEVVDPLTVEVTLSSAEPLFDAILGPLNYIGSPTAIKELGDQFGGSPVGAGPFVFDEWVRGSFMHATKNPDYFEEGKPYLDEITMRAMPDPVARVNALLAGEADVGTTSMDAIDQIESAGLGAFPNSNDTAFGGAGLVFNTTSPPFDDKDVRCGLMQAIDVEKMNDQLANGNSTVYNSFLHRGPAAEGAAEVPAYDPEAAQAAFDAYAARTGGPVQFTFGAERSNVTEVEYHLTQLTEFDNVDAGIDAQEVADLIGAVFRGGHQVAQLGWTSDYPPGISMAAFLRTEDGGPHPWTGYTSPELEALLDTAATTTDEAERVEVVRGLNDILAEECLFRPTPRVSGGPPYGRDGIRGWAISTLSVFWEDVWVQR